MPAAAGVQVPTEPARLQAWQVWVQALLQQTPSTQLPLAQSDALPQATPWARLGRQEVASQKNPVRHWASRGAGGAARPVLSRTTGAQLRVPPGLQVPAPSQVLAASSVDPVQLPGAHSLPAT